MKPITTWDKRLRADKQARELYRKRRDIERRREQQELKKQIKEVWE